MPGITPKISTKLAECAFEMFAEHGFGNVTIDDIAKHAGVTKGSFYSHYKSKQEVILAACTHFYRSNQEKMAEVMASASDPLVKLKAVLKHTVRGCVKDDQRRVFTSELFSLALQDEEVRRTWMQFQDTMRETYVGLVLAVRPNHRKTAIRQSVNFMLATIYGIKMQSVVSPYISGPAEQQAIVDRLLDIALSDVHKE